MALILTVLITLYIDDLAEGWVVERAKPLTDAIEFYCRDHGTPPASLELLQPDYLAEWPEGIPDFEYSISDDGQWSLSAGIGETTYTELMYASDPSLLRPDRVLRRIGDWAIVKDG